MSRSRTSWTCHLGSCIAGGTRRMDFLWRIWSWWIAATSMIWSRCCLRAWRIGRAVVMRWIRILVAVIPLWLYISSVRSHKERRVLRSTGRLALSIWLVARDWRSPSLRVRWSKKLETSTNLSLRWEKSLKDWQIVDPRLPTSPIEIPS